jgi:hypothetical protein
LGKGKGSRRKNKEITKHVVTFEEVKKEEEVFEDDEDCSESDSEDDDEGDAPK